MSELRKANFEGTFFVTFTVVGWIDVFTREMYCDEIIKNLIYCQKNKGLEIYAYVIMPSHIHLVVSRKEGLLSDWIRDFKSFMAKQIVAAINANPQESRKEWLNYMFSYFAKGSKQNQDFMFWQKTNHPVELYTEKVIEQKIDYIHNNPVEAGIVTQAEFYKYSSANIDGELKIDIL